MIRDPAPAPAGRAEVQIDWLPVATARRRAGFARRNRRRDQQELSEAQVAAWRLHRGSTSRAAVTEAGRFGNEGRNVVRGPALSNIDVSLARTFRVAEFAQLQFRAECFNLANRANFGLPVADFNSSNFGKIFTAAPPRLMQFALKLIF